MTDIWQNLRFEKRPILLYGSGDGAQKIYNELLKNGIKISGVFASDGFKKKRDFCGFEIMPFAKAREVFGSFLALFAFGSSSAEVIEFTKELMKTGEILCAEMPVCGELPFDLTFARAHRKELEAVYNILADDQSKKVFEQTVMFKIEGNIQRLFDCETDENEAFENILKLQSHSSFLDLGAYNGDTVLDFAERVQDYSHITAVEPDKKSFEKLRQNTKELSITCINAAVSDKNQVVTFNSKGGRGSVMGGSEQCDCITIDSLNGQFDYIKFDIEGEELSAIRGGQKTIAAQKPKMLISCYHRIEDYFSIPLEVLKIRNDYKVYMRHYPCIPAWETNFYFV